MSRLTRPAYAFGFGGLARRNPLNPVN
jgi:hypothetical protein